MILNSSKETLRVPQEDCDVPSTSNSLSNGLTKTKDISPVLKVYSYDTGILNRAGLRELPFHRGLDVVKSH